MPALRPRPREQPLRLDAPGHRGPRPIDGNPREGRRPAPRSPGDGGDRRRGPGGAPPLPGAGCPRTDAGRIRGADARHVVPICGRREPASKRCAEPIGGTDGVAPSVADAGRIPVAVPDRGRPDLHNPAGRHARGHRGEVRDQRPRARAAERDREPEPDSLRRGAEAPLTGGTRWGAVNQRWHARQYEVASRPPTWLMVTPQRRHGCPPRRWTLRWSRTCFSKVGATRARRIAMDHSRVSRIAV